MSDNELRGTEMVVYAGKDALELATTGHIAQAQVALLARKTPAKFIKSRRGRGGKTLDYVEISYVQAVLNATFAFDWDVEVKDKIINYDENYIAILIELRARLADGREIRKHAWGGSDIKRDRDTGKLVDFADDLKAAQSDAIKKAASMMGVAHDVFAGLTKATEEPQDAPKPLSRFHLLKEFEAARKNLGDRDYYNVLAESGGWAHANEVPPQDRATVLENMRLRYQKLSREKNIEKKS